MFTVEKLQKIDFFKNKTAILQSNEKLGIEDVLLPRPMVTAKEGELQLIIKTNSKFDFEQNAAFIEKLNKIFGDGVEINVFDEGSLKSAIGAGIGMTETYRHFLQSAIPLNALKENVSLDEQWRVQKNRTVAIHSSPRRDPESKANMKGTKMDKEATPEKSDKTNGVSQKKR